MHWRLPETFGGARPRSTSCGERTQLYLAIDKLETLSISQGMHGATKQLRCTLPAVLSAMDASAMTDGSARTMHPSAGSGIESADVMTRLQVHFSSAHVVVRSP